MGMGDELMAIGHARRMLRERGLRGRVEVLDKAGCRRMHPLWQHVPEIAKPGQHSVTSIVDSGGCRPYVDYERTTPERWAWNLEHRPAPGELYGVRPDTRARGLILIEPSIKRSASPNKQWGRWQELVDSEPSLPWAQIGTHATQWLRGVRRIQAPTFEDACALLAACRFAILPEGGLHHAAAAMEVRAVVLFGPYMPPAVTGYPFHANLAIDEPEATGWRTPSTLCRQAWQAITPQTVIEAATSRGWA